MQKFDSRKAKEVYSEIRQNPAWKFPITAQVVDGILQWILYWHHDISHEWSLFFQLSVRWEILMRSEWKGKWWTRIAIQNILNLSQKSYRYKKAA